MLRPRIHTKPALLVLAVACCAFGGCDASSPKEPAGEPPGKQASPVTEDEDRAGKPLMLVFTRDYCTPCQVMKPWVREIAEEHTGLDVVSLNVDRKKNERFGSLFKISAVPMLIYADGEGKIVRRVEGIASKEQMKSTLRGLGWSD